MRRVVPAVLLLTASARADGPTEAPSWMSALFGDRARLEPPGEELGPDFVRRSGGTSFDLANGMVLRVAGGDRLLDPHTGIDPAATDALSGPIWGSAELTFYKHRFRNGWILDFGLEWRLTLGDLTHTDATRPARKRSNEVIVRGRLRF